MGLNSKGRLLTSSAKLGWKGLTMANPLAYYDTELIAAAKSLIVQAKGLNLINNNVLSLKGWQNKLECLFPAILLPYV
jgi:hypothetical protein